MKYFLNPMNIKNLFGVLNNVMNLCSTSYTVSKNLMWIGTWFPHKLPTFNFPLILLISFILSFIVSNIVFNVLDEHHTPDFILEQKQNSRV